MGRALYNSEVKVFKQPWSTSALRVLALLGVLLVGPRLLAQEPVGAAATATEAASDRARWDTLSEHSEPGAAISAVRDALRRHADSPWGWRALWRLAGRTGDFALAHEAQLRTLALGRAADQLTAMDLCEGQLALRQESEGQSHAQAQTLKRCIALRKEAGGDSTNLDNWLARTELQAHLRAHPDPAALQAAVSTAHERGAWRDEHRLLCDLAYHCWITGDYRAGRAHYERILEIDTANPQHADQIVRDWNGAARMELELALAAGAGLQPVALARAIELATKALSTHVAQGLGGPADLVRNHCVLAQASALAGDDVAASKHYAEEFALVCSMRREVLIEGDRALRIFHGAQDHIFADYALHLAQGAKGRPADLQRAIAVSEEGRVGALQELQRLRGAKASALASSEPMSPAALPSEGTLVLIYLAGSRDAGVIALNRAGARFAALGSVTALDASALALAQAT